MIVPAALALVFLAAEPTPAAGAGDRYEPEALAVLERMAASGAALRDYTMTLVRRELIGKDLTPGETYLVKWQRPQRIYLKQIAGPNEGQEVLYANGWNKGRVKVHKGSFPDWTVNLDPRGRLAMARAHHPIPEVSLPGFVERVRDNVARARAARRSSASRP